MSDPLEFIKQLTPATGFLLDTFAIQMHEPRRLDPNGVVDSVTGARVESDAALRARLIAKIKSI